MTSVDYDIIPRERVSGYDVRCYSCDRQFDATAATWCHCGLKTRTLNCPGCAKCFCRSSSRYKERFWAEAPRSLRENANRFHIGDEIDFATASPVWARPRVLIVDDEEDMRSLAACYVEQLGYDVSTISSPKDVLELLESTAFDVVMTDVLMPGLDGRELCKQIKEAHGDSIKVIVMTSLYTASRYRTEAIHRFGVDLYLEKPLRFGLLKDALDRIAPIVH